MYAIAEFRNNIQTPVRAEQGESMSVVYIWLIAGAGLILAELAVPGFVIFFFGLGAFGTAAAAAIFPGMTFLSQVLLFAVLSCIFLFLFRRWMPRIAHGRKTAAPLPEDGDEYAGEQAVVVAPITPDAPGKIDFHGSVWSAAAAEPHGVGEHVIIVQRENITYIVK